MKVRGNRTTCRTGFSLLEMLVVIAIIALLMSLVLPAIQSVREQMRTAECANRLRQLGDAFHDRLSKSSRGEFSSGAWMLDGDPQKVGWLADLQTMNTSDALLFCPSNPARMTESLSRPALKGAYERGQLPFTATSSQLDGKLDDYRDFLMKNGFNTNYCQNWQMARTELLPLANRPGYNPADPSSVPPGSPDPADVYDRANSYGPLSHRLLRNAPSDNVVLLGDGEPIAALNNEFAAGLTGGPRHHADPASLQDFQVFGGVHGGSAVRQANLLFADGHVEAVSDENRNGLWDDDEWTSASVWLKRIRVR